MERKTKWNPHPVQERFMREKRVTIHVSGTGRPSMRLVNDNVLRGYVLGATWTDETRTIDFGPGQPGRGNFGLINQDPRSTERDGT